MPTVYDPETEGEQRYHDPDLSHPQNLDPKDNKPAGDPRDPRTIHKDQGGAGGDAESASDLRDAERSGDGGYFNADGDQEAGAGTGASLRTQEKTGSGTSSAGGGNFSFNDSEKGGGSFKAALEMATKHKKGIGIGAGVGGGLAAVSVSVFLMLIPLKIEHIVQNLEDRFFSTSEDAVDKESRKMFTQYMTKHVLPGYKGKCGTTIDKTCTPVGLGGTNPVSKMYKSWANARLENKLAEDYGIEFKYDTQSKNWYLKAPGAKPGGDNIGPDGSGLNTDFNRKDRAALRSAVSDAFQDETRWKKVMFRYKVGRLLEEKYGLKRCIIFCGTRDKFADKKDLKLQSAKLELVQRVITPHAQTLGTIMECLITSCDPTQTSPTTAEDGSTGELHGSPESSTETTIETSGREAAQKFAGETGEQMAKSVETIRDRGFTRWIFEEVLKKVGLSDVLAKQLSSTVPVVGWISKVSTIIHFAHHAGPTLKKLGYLANAYSAVQLYQMYRTYADEIHTGHVDATEIGSMTDSLSPGDHGTADDPQVGGTAGAESTPLYQNLIDHQSGSSTSGSKNASYTCQDGKPVPSGQLVCPEEMLGAVNGVGGVVTSVSNFFDLPVVSSISSVADAVYKAQSGIFGVIGDLTGWIFKNVPPFNLGADALSAGTQFLVNQLQPFFKSVLDTLIPNPFSDNMSGGRTFDMMAAGSDVAGNDYAHTGLGGKKLKPSEVADIVNQQQDQAKQTFDHQPFFARMFDTGSQYSLISKLAMAIPIGTQAQAQSGLAAILDPLNTLSHGFASLLSGRVSAAVTAQNDPFGITQYGYTSDDLDKIGDPETYWNDHCSNNASYAYMKNNNWNKDAAKKSNIDPDTGMPVNNTTNPCLLIMATVGSAGGYFDTGNLTSDDLADLNGSGGGSGSGSGGGGPVTGIPGSGSGKFTTDTSHPAYPGLDQMLAEVKKVSQTSPGPLEGATAAFCRDISTGSDSYPTCASLCESAVEWAWLGHRGQYNDPFGSAGDTPASDSAWAAALKSGHAHPGSRNVPVGALLIYNRHDPADKWGHIAIYLGNNQVFSTDFDYYDDHGVGIQPASSIENATGWTNSYVGWMDPYFSGKVGN